MHAGTYIRASHLQIPDSSRADATPHVRAIFFSSAQIHYSRRLLPRYAHTPSMAIAQVCLCAGSMRARYGKRSSYYIHLVVTLAREISAFMRLPSSAASLPCFGSQHPRTSLRFFISARARRWGNLIKSRDNALIAALEDCRVGRVESVSGFRGEWRYIAETRNSWCNALNSRCSSLHARPLWIEVMRSGFFFGLDVDWKIGMDRLILKMNVWAT